MNFCAEPLTGTHSCIIFSSVNTSPFFKKIIIKIDVVEQSPIIFAMLKNGLWFKTLKLKYALCEFKKDSVEHGLLNIQLSLILVIFIMHIKQAMCWVIRNSE